MQSQTKEKLHRSLGSNNTHREQMNIVIAGHVDHGKSTIIGRLLADTNSLPDGKLEQIKAMCEMKSMPFEYAFLLDALKDERSQGITIDSARVFFKTEKRNYIIIDAPGHIEFLKNMVSGASRAEAALLVIDAGEGIKENSKRHGYMMSMLGIKQIAVVVNKMDLVDYDEVVYNRIVRDYKKFLVDININPNCFIPVSGMKGDNIATLNGKMDWYRGSSLLDVLDNFAKEKPTADKPFRMPVQDIYKFTGKNDNRRIVAGTIESGKLNAGDEIVFYPSGKRSRVKSFEGFNMQVQNTVESGYAVGFTLVEQIYITRGEVAVRAGEKKPVIAKKIKVNLFWLGKKPFLKKKDYLLKIGTSKVSIRLEEVSRIINASDLSSINKADKINRHEVAECVLSLTKAIAFDKADEIAATSRFVIVDDYEIAGGGIITDGVEDKLSRVRENVVLRNYKWEKSNISLENRAQKYNQKSTLLLITGPKRAGKKEVAKSLEASLFSDGKIVYFLGIGNVLYGIDADIKGNDENNREEHLRRLSEVVHILLDAGIILIVTAVELTSDDLEIIKTIVRPDLIEVVWVSEENTTDIPYTLKVPGIIDIEDSVEKIKILLQEKGIIFKPW